MLLTIIYRLIVLFFVVLLFYDVFKEEKKSLQLTAAVALIPFILRFLMIK
jgi:uncharacterized membrane protein